MNNYFFKDYSKILVPIRCFSTKLKSTYYDVLGVEKTCSFKEIRDAFIKKSKEYHPDSGHKLNSLSNQQLNDKFKEINQAYQILSNALKRQEYDQFISKKEFYPQYSMSKEDYYYHLRYGFRERSNHSSNRSNSEHKDYYDKRQTEILKSWSKIQAIIKWLIIAGLIFHVLQQIIFRYAFHRSKYRARGFYTPYIDVYQDKKSD